MTVGELRAELADYPDNKRIAFVTREESFDDVAIVDYADTGWGKSQVSLDLTDALLVFVR